MHENKKKYFIIFIICFCISIIFSGCVSNRQGQTEQSFLDYQRRIDELAARNQDLERKCNTAADRLSDINGKLTNIINRNTERLEDIRKRADSMDESISRIVYLFGEYESEVNRIIDELDKIRTEE